MAVSSRQVEGVEMASYQEHHVWRDEQKKIVVLDWLKEAR
jgi:hypothetical protein